MSEYRNYKGQSVGRALHFLYYYIPIGVDELVFGNNTVEQYGKVVATITWDNDTPHFDFKDEELLRKQYFLKPFIAGNSLNVKGVPWIVQEIQNTLSITDGKYIKWGT